MFDVVHYDKRKLSDEHVTQINSMYNLFICDEGTRSAAAATDSVLPWQRSERAQRCGHTQSYQDVDQIVTTWKSNRPKHRRMFLHVRAIHIKIKTRVYCQNHKTQ